MKESERLKFELETIRISVMLSIDAILRKHDDQLLLDDVQGNLVTNVIDDQESEVIHRIWRKYHDHKAVIVAGVGVYEEDTTVPIEEYEVEFLINILEAAEMASEDIIRDKKLDELEAAEKN